MGHFAKVLDGKVERMIVAEPEFFDTFKDSSPGKWLQCSYNTRGGVHVLGGTPLRKNYPGIGWNYDADADAFYPPQPFPSWMLNAETFLWEAPAPYPETGGPYQWDEETTAWVAL